MSLRLSKLTVVAFALTATMAFYSANATTFYITTDGNDENDGSSIESAFLTLAKAVEVASNSTDTAEILIAPGTYTQTAAIRIAAPISIRGTGAAATNVVLKNTTSGQHVITLAHADAELALVTLTRGSATIGPACLGIEAGLVRDCWVTGCVYNVAREKTGGHGFHERRAACEIRYQRKLHDQCQLERDLLRGCLCNGRRCRELFDCGKRVQLAQ